MVTTALLLGLALLGAALAWRGGRASAPAPESRERLAERIDAILPQTQCGQCGFGGCRPYAEAIAAGEAGINRCPPGGARGIAALAELLDRPALPLDPECGEEKPPQVIQACPVDCIIGASRLMHTVIADECTGCELCVPACPVDCIVMRDLPADHPRPA